jgi:hypothetical protein
MSNLEFPSVVDRLTEKYIESVRKHEDEVIAKRCEELNIPVPTEDMIGQYRFGPFLQVTDHNFNRYIYYNNGSKGGLFVVGFVSYQEMHPTKFDLSIYTSVVTEEPEHLKL